ncbi:hypothetical protein [Pantoea sp. C2G6]
MVNYKYQITIDDTPAFTLHEQADGGFDQGDHPPEVRYLVAPG